ATAFIISSRIKRHPQTWNPRSLQFMSVSELRKISDVFDFQSHNFHALVACGGFSYGDVLGAGEGWAKSILFNHRVRDEFETFFH
ncbi:phosphoribosylformylglycinamidine synthase subunit PurQ, partial [Salmonella enterica subsp. enterica serovar Kentucky]|nr:phosphoribosylformylglycinamidine synthase subunit PurQ [Salmonella enterica subsp. enterica serovar Kentucky]